MPLSLYQRRAAALAVAATAAAFAVPASAGAAYTGTVAGNAITLTGDNAADNLVISDGSGASPLLQHNLPLGASGFDDNTDFDSTPGVVATHPADGTADLTVRAGDGNDTVNVSGNVARATIDGQGGDDIITGSPKADPITGGDGNDRITGFRGNDDVDGGNGNDVMIWNNGDGTDTNDGEAGNDEVLITNGTANDDMNVTAPVAGRVLFERINAPFKVDIATVEKLVITSFSGDDKLATAAGITLPMSIDAGSGADQISTGDGADLIQGGDDNDTLNGGAGPDRLVGDRGADTMNGGGADDTLVWNNGDGSDVMNGDDGVDRVENNLSAADDVSTVKPAGGRVRYDRVSPGPFSLDIGSSEALEINNLAGNDNLTVSPGVGSLIAITADGGAGNDTLTGAEEADTFAGGSGDDALDPGAGNDVADGQDGDDRMTIRDGAADLARGGAGTDSAVADAAVVDAVAPDVEAVDRLAGADTTGTPVGLAGGKRKVAIKKGRASLRLSLSCPAAEDGGCKGTLSLLTAKKVRIGGSKLQALLATASYDLEGGERKTLRVKLPKGVQRLATKRKLAVRAQAISRDAAGNVAQTSASMTLQFPKKK